MSTPSVKPVSGPGSSGPDAAPAPLRLSAGDDAIRSWLSVLGSMLRLPDAQAASIRDELESHLRLRVRDLMIEGHSEPRAVGLAIEELGDAASLAQRYRDAFENPFRRRLMHSVLMLAAGAAVSVGTLAVLRPPVSPPTQDRPAQAGQAPTMVKSPAIPPQVALPPRSEIAAGATAQVILELIVAPMGRELLIKWDDLEQAGLSPEAKSVRPFAWTDPIEALRTVGSAFDLADQEPMRLALYDFPEQPFVSTQGQVAAASRMETRTIDVTGLLSLAGQTGKTEALVEVVRAAVFPEVWDVNGGDCTISSFGPLLVVRARDPVQLKMRDVLDDLETKLTKGKQNRAQNQIDVSRRINESAIDLTRLSETRFLQVQYLRTKQEERGTIFIGGLEADLRTRILRAKLPEGTTFAPSQPQSSDPFEALNKMLSGAEVEVSIDAVDADEGQIWIRFFDQRVSMRGFSVKVPASRNAIGKPTIPAPPTQPAR